MCNCIPGSTVLKLFANDAKLYTTVSGDGTCGDLQTCLSTVFKWSESQQLRLAPHKCAVMHLKPRRLNSQNDQIYSINNCALPVVDSYKDLGITYDMHLSYTPHVGLQNITARASQRAKLILTCFTTRNPDVGLLMKAFIVYVRLMLEFSSTVWNPMTKQNICKVELVQKRFTKRLVGLSKISYNRRLEMLNIESLEERRL